MVQTLSGRSIARGVQRFQRDAGGDGGGNLVRLPAAGDNAGAETGDSTADSIARCAVYAGIVRNNRIACPSIIMMDNHPINYIGLIKRAPIRRAEHRNTLRERHAALAESRFRSTFRCLRPYFRRLPSRRYSLQRVLTGASPMPQARTKSAFKILFVKNSESISSGFF